MHVAHILFNLYLGGTESMLLDIMRCQADLGAHISLVLINDGHSQDLLKKIDPRVDVYFVQRPTGSHNPWHVLRLNWLLRKLNPDIIHSHLSSAGGMVFGQRCPLCLTVHSARLGQRFMNRFDQIWAISHAVQADIRQRFGLDSEVIFNGIDCEEMTSTEKPHTLLPGIFRIIQISRLHMAQKGQDVLARAVHYGYEHGLFGNTRLKVDLIGDGDDRTALEALVKDLGIEQYVNFKGVRDRAWIYSNLHNYDLLVQPSRLEGFGLTIAEGMAARVPILVSDIDGPKELTQNGRYGLVFHNEDPADLASQIAEVMNNYSHYSHQARGRNFDYVTKNFDITVTSARYLDAYARAIAERKNR